MRFELFHGGNVLDTDHRHGIPGLSGNAAADYIDMRVIQQYPSQSPLFCPDRIYGRDTFLFGFPFIIRAVVMIPHNGNDTVFGLQAFQNIRKRSYLIRMHRYEISAEDYKIRIFSIYLVDYPRQHFRPVPERTQVHVGYMDDPIPVERGRYPVGYYLRIIHFQGIAPEKITQQDKYRRKEKRPQSVYEYRMETCSERS